MKYALLALTSYQAALSELGALYPELLVCYNEIDVQLCPMLNATHPGITDFTVPAPSLICDGDGLMSELQSRQWTNINILAVGSSQEEMWANLDANQTALDTYKAFQIAQFDAEDQRGWPTLTYPDGEGGTFDVSNPNYMQYRRIANWA